MIEGFNYKILIGKRMDINRFRRTMIGTCSSIFGEGSIVTISSGDSLAVFRDISEETYKINVPDAIYAHLE